MSPRSWFRLLGVAALLLVVGFAVPALTDDAKKGKKYALLVGVTSYDHSSFPALRWTENDVEKLHDVLTSKSGGFDSVRVLSQTRGKKNGRDKPTAENVRAAIEELLAGKKRNDTVLIALSGHGATVTVDDPEDKAKPKTYPFFAPANADLRGVSYSSGKSKTLINLDHFFDDLKTCGAGVKLVLVDACRNEMKAQSATRNLDVATVTVPRNVAALFSCSEDEKAWENETLKHGVFFHFVLEGLRGEAKNKDGEVTWSRLSEYVRNRVTKEVGKIVGDGAKQTPHEVGNVRGASPVLVRIDAKEDAPSKEKDGGTKVVDAPKDKSGKEAMVKGLLDTDGKNSIDMKFVLVKKGKFTMGSRTGEKDRETDEHEHAVEITKDFYLGVTEVTQKQYKAIMGTNPSYFSAEGGGKDKVTGLDTDDFPVENVSWDDAKAFVVKLNALAAEKDKGRKYRLPTEAEWEYACRGGVSSKKYHSGDSISTDDANFDNKLGRTAKVGSYPANKFGLHDMHGNVWEWCEDWYDEKFYRNSPAHNPLNLEAGSFRVYRGGSWLGTAGYCRSAYRSRDEPETRNDYLGFRVVLVPAR